jgi:hypothetical protein
MVQRLGAWAFIDATIVRGFFAAAFLGASSAKAARRIGRPVLEYC